MYLATSINESPVIVKKAGAAITDVRGKAVKFSSGNVVLAGAGEAAIGIGILTNDENIASGADVHIQIKDIGVVVTGAAVAAGAELTSDANGKLVTATAGNFIVGIALEAAAAAGTMIQAQIVKLGYKPTPQAAVALSELTDVDLTTAPTDGQSLKYEAASTKWKAAT